MPDPPAPPPSFLERLSLAPTTTLDARGKRVRLLPVGLFLPGPAASSIEPRLLAAARRAMLRSVSAGDWVRFGLVAALETAVIVLSIMILPVAISIPVSRRWAWLPAFMIVFAILAILGTWLQIKRESATRLAAALVSEAHVCASCGYSLRGLTPDPHDRCITCPECQAAWRSTPVPA